MRSSAARKRKGQRTNYQPNDPILPLRSTSDVGLEDAKEKATNRRITRWRGTSSRRCRCIVRAVVLVSFGLLLFLLAIDEGLTSHSLSWFPSYEGHSNVVPLSDATVALVSLHHGFKYSGSLGRFFKNNKQSYASSHRYAYTDEFPDEHHLIPLKPWQQEHNRHLYYQKPRFLLFLMEKYKENLEWLLWIDGDAIVTQHNVRIEDRVEEFRLLHQKRLKEEKGDENGTTLPLCMIWAKDSAPNAGILLLRNSPTTRALLQTSLSTFEDTDAFRKFTDQASLTSAIQRNETYQDCQLLLETQRSSPTLIQSRVRGPSSWLWQPGHWILHLPNHNRFELLTSLKMVGQRMKESSLPIFPPVSMPKLDTLPAERQKRFEAVRAAIRHAWTSYASFCLDSAATGGRLRSSKSPARPNRLASHIPADDLSPLSQAGHDWLHHAATLYDSLDTLVIAGLHEEYQAALSVILRQDIQSTALQPTKTFEYSLRIVGGLLGAFSMTGDARLLFRAKDAADALLQSPFRSSPNTLPRMYDVLFPPRNGSFLYKVYSRIYQWGRDVFTKEHHFNSLAGVGSFAMEFHFLSRVLGLNVYKDAANGIFKHVAKHQHQDGIVPDYWNVMTGSPAGISGGLGSGSDSFYESLLKVPLAGCEKEGGTLTCQTESDATLQEMLALYNKVTQGALRSNHVFRKTTPVQTSDPLSYPVEHGNSFHHLLCFLPGMVALGAANVEGHQDGDMTLAEELLQGCHDLYEQTTSGLGPEQIKSVGAGQQQPVGDLSYLLRPEYVESIFVLYRLTGDAKYQDMGWKVFESLERYCKTETGYTGLKDVYDPEEGGRIDDMPSYFIAETLKYLLLLFGPNDYISLDDYVFTTEAHPIRRMRNDSDMAGVFLDAAYNAVPAPFPWLLGWVVVILVGLVIAFLSMVARATIVCSPRLWKGGGRNKSS